MRFRALILGVLLPLLAVVGCGDVVVRANHTYVVEIVEKHDDWVLLKFTLNEFGERNDVNDGPSRGILGGMSQTIKVVYGVPFSETISDGSKRYGLLSGVVDKSGIPALKFEYSYKYR